MKLGIDIDGVLACFMDPAKDIVEAVTGRIITEPAKDWGWTNWNLTKEQDKEVWRRIAATPNFWLTLPLLPGTNPSDLIKLDKKHTLFFITTRIPTAGLRVEKQSAYWLSYKLGLTQPTVIVTKDKGKVAAALGLDAFIDDKPENLACIMEDSPTTEVFLQDASYNKNELRFARVATFEEFAKKYVADNG